MPIAPTVRLAIIAACLPLAITACQAAPEQTSASNNPAVANTLAAAGSTAASTDGYAGQALPDTGYDWMPLQVQGELARLIYGRRDSDDVPLAFSCLAGSGLVLATVMDQEEGPSLMQLATAGMTTRLPAHTMYEQELTQTLQRAHLRSQDPIFSSIRRQGWVAVNAFGKWRALVPQPGTALELDAFLAHCAAGN